MAARTSRKPGGCELLEDKNTKLKMLLADTTLDPVTLTTWLHWLVSSLPPS